MHKGLTFLSVAAAAALPTSLPISTLCDGGFDVQITTPNGPLTLKAVANGTDSAFVAVGQDISLPGSVVTINGTSPAASLSFEIDGENYGWIVGDVVSTCNAPKTFHARQADILQGHVWNAVNVVGAQKNYEELKFTITDDGSIFHLPTAATNVWLGTLFESLLHAGIL